MLTNTSKIYFISILLKQSKVAFFCWLIFFSSSAFSQSVITKSLPKPTFFVLGALDTKFPKMQGNWDDTLALKEYGKSVDQWLQSNPQNLQELKITTSKNQINSDFFKTLNEQEKIKFKEIAQKLAYIISGQKNILLNDYFSKYPTKSKSDFYNEVEQIYLIHQVDLNYLIKLIKG